MPPFGKIEPNFTENNDAVEPILQPEVQEAQFAQPEVAPLRSRINKKRAVMLLLFVGIIIGAAAFLTLQNKSPEKSASVPAQPITFIDDNEPQNKLLKENSAAKNDNVNVFDFDVNKCLQQFSDEQCVDMYEKSLLVTEKK